MQDALDRAIETVGSVRAVARAMGISGAAVSRWRTRGYVPATRAIELEQLCEAAVTRYELRPDVFGERRR